MPAFRDTGRDRPGHFATKWRSKRILRHRFVWHDIGAIKPGKHCSGVAPAKSDTRGPRSNRGRLRPDAAASKGTRHQPAAVGLCAWYCVSIAVTVHLTCRALSKKSMLSADSSMPVGKAARQGRPSWPVPAARLATHAQQGADGRGPPGVPCDRGQWVNPDDLSRWAAADGLSPRLPRGTG